MKSNEYYIKEALKEAKKAYLIDEVPVGCVIVHNDKIIARGHNLKENSISCKSNIWGNSPVSIKEIKNNISNFKKLLSK